MDRSLHSILGKTFLIWSMELGICSVQELGSVVIEDAGSDQLDEAMPFSIVLS